MHRDRTGELVDDDPAPDEHRCTAGWLGEDHLGRPIPCPTCRPNTVKRKHVDLCPCGQVHRTAVSA